MVLDTARRVLEIESLAVREMIERLELTEEKMPAIMELYQTKLDSLASAVR